MNIALINPEYNSPSGFGRGGIATYTYNIASALSSLGHNVCVFVRKGVNTDIVDQDIKVVEFDRAPLPIFKKIIARLFQLDTWEEEFSYGLYETLMQTHSKSNFNIVDIPEYNGLALAFKNVKEFSLIVNFRTPRKIVNQFNNTKDTPIDKKIYKLEKNALKNTKTYRTSSSALQLRVSTLYNIPIKNIEVIRNPMTAIEHNKNLIKDNTKFKILFSGRLEPRKGLELLLQIPQKIFNISTNIEIVIAGETGEGNKIIDMFTESIIPKDRKRIIFLGPLNREELYEAYLTCDLFIFPSTFDNSPNSLLEAMAAGMPILASNAEGVNELIFNNKNGLLFKPNDSESFLEQLKKLFNNKDLRERLSLQAKSDIVKKYSPEIIAKETANFYAKVLGKAL